MVRRSMRLLAWLPVVLLPALLFGGSGAEAAGWRYLVLVIAGLDEHQGIAENAAEVLIARLAQAGIESVGPEVLARDFSDPGALRRCAVDLGCISRAAAAIGTQRVLLGLMGRQGEQVSVSVEVIDVEARRSLARRSARLAEHELASRLLELSGEVLDSLEQGGGTKATLVLRIEGGTAQLIALDGKTVGSGKSWTLERIEPGEHELRLELADGSKVYQHLSLEPGKKELVVRVGEAALPWERSYQRGEEALQRGALEQALREAQAALAEPAADQPEVHLLLARACLGLLKADRADGDKVVLAFQAAQRARDLKGGPPALRMRSELTRRFAQVRLEPGPGWRQQGPIELQTVRSDQPRLSRSIADRLARQGWDLPQDVYLPRPGHYRLNGRDLLVEEKAEGRPLILALSPAPRRASSRAWINLALLGALGGGDLEEPVLGLAATLLPWCSGAGCLTARLEGSTRFGEVEREQGERRLWLRAGPGWAWPLLEGRLRLDVSVDALYALDEAELGLGLGGAVSWLVLPHLRLGLRPSWNLLELKVQGSTIGAQLELALEL